MNFLPFLFALPLVVTSSINAFGQALDDQATARRFAPATEVDAWNKLPRKNPSLPTWVRMLVTELPKTTGSMLELNRIHRADNPLGTLLAAKLRWVVARTLESDYGIQYAEFDLRGAGLSDAEIKELSVGFDGFSPADQTALKFARDVTVAASNISDDDFQEMLTYFTAEQLVALVHTVAFANFENRIYLALDVGVEETGPVPPIDYELDRAARKTVVAPARIAWNLMSLDSKTGTTDPPDWDHRSFADLESALALQTKRAPRIPWPDSARLAELSPANQGRANRIAWAKISLGYQPLLTSAWFECMGLFQLESAIDPVFENSVFWVITRSNNCFY